MTGESGSAGADLSPEAFERAGRQACRLAADWLEGLDARGVRPQTDTAALFVGSLGETGVGPEACVGELARAMEGSLAIPGPMYFGLLNSTPLRMGPIADLIASTINNNGGAIEQGPAIWQAEQEVLRVFSGLVDPTGATWGGMMLPGGTFANLQALIVARDRARAGHGAAAGRGRIYFGDCSHFSIARACAVLGIGGEAAVAVETVGRGTVDPMALRDRLAADRAAGICPIAVVATAGSTSTGGIDRLDAIAAICEEFGSWLHVDACYGGAALLVDAREALGGIERANSVALDPHKWFFCPLVANVLLFRDPGASQACFDLDVSYIPREPDAVADPFRQGMATSRRAMGLVVWATLRAHGLAAIRDAVERNIQQARWIEHQLAIAGFEVLAEGRLSIACARCVPPDWTVEQVDGLQQRVAAAICREGTAWFATTRHQGVLWLCLRMTNHRTEQCHMERLAQAVIGQTRACIDLGPTTGRPD